VDHLIPSHQGKPSDDPIFALNREATTRKKAGEAIVNATVGALLDDQGALAVLPTAAQTLREVPSPEWAAYAPIAGSPDFLEAAMDDLLGTQPTLRAMAVAAATPGGTGALRHAIANFLEAGQSLLTTNFYWGPYQTLADEAERKVATFNMFTPEGTMDLGALDAGIGERLTRDGRCLVFLNDPCHNPTGYSMSDAEWSGAVEILARHGQRGPVTLLVDCAYFAYNPKEPRAFLRHLLPLVDKVQLLFAWSASKTFTHYGLRVGALVACVPDEKRRKDTEAALSYSCRGTWSNCNRGGLAAITRLLKEEPLRLACDRERDVFKAQLHARVEAFNRLARPRGLRYPRYEGGFFVTVFTDDAHAKAEAMKKDGVFVVPQKGALRVALCSVAERDVPQLVESLGRHAR
jgi:aromatic-amino-acid transaminase